MTIFDRSQKIGRLGSELYDRSGQLVAGIRCIHRSDFVSAWWYLSMGGFCPDKSREAYEAWVEQDDTPDLMNKELPTQRIAPKQPSLFSPDVTARNGGGR